MKFLILSSVLLGLISMKASQAQTSKSDEPALGLWNVKFPTMGGKQFWTDMIHFYQWRIQQNSMTGHFRLIDQHNVRHAWGNRAHCEKELEKIARDQGLGAMKGDVIIMMHGLARSRSSLDSLGQYLRKKTGATVVNMSYASTRANLDSHAAALHSVIRHMPEVDNIYFVCHSMGNIVVRRYLHNYKEAKSGVACDSRIRRMVMLGPPNQGSALARIANYSHVYKFATGKSGQELSKDWQKTRTKLAIPSFEFAIIAGSTEKGWVKNPVLNGDSDLFVKVEETRLKGAADHQSLPTWHGFMMNDETVHQYVLNFFKHGFLKSAAEKTAIE